MASKEQELGSARAPLMSEGLTMTSQGSAVDRKLVWSGRPSVSVYYSIYGAIAIFVIANLTIAELGLGFTTSSAKPFFLEALEAFLIRLNWRLLL